MQEDLEAEFQSLFSLLEELKEGMLVKIKQDRASRTYELQVRACVRAGPGARRHAASAARPSLAAAPPSAPLAAQCPRVWRPPVPLCPDFAVLPRVRLALTPPMAPLGP